MGWRLTSAAASLTLAATGGVATAHHSAAAFDQAHPIELVGVVQEFRFTNPHSVIVLEVKGEDPQRVIWQLEGNSANSLAWGGWSSMTISPGDQLRVTIDPLRSGAPGGAWSPNRVRFIDGSAPAPSR